MKTLRLLSLCVATLCVVACGSGSGESAAGSESQAAPASASESAATAVSAQGPATPSSLAQPPPAAGDSLLPTPSDANLQPAPSSPGAPVAPPVPAAPFVDALPVPTPLPAPEPAPAPLLTPAPPSIRSHELSGTLRVADTLDADSDTNDSTAATWRPNDSIAQAQSIVAPVLLTGYVNRAGAGPAGRTQAAGDLDDVFRVQVAAGQLVEIEFTGEVPTDDLDLWIYTPAGVFQGSSLGTNSRYECVQFTSAGEYLVNVRAYAGAANYLLRVGSPGTAQRCPNVTLAQSNLVAGELIVQARPGLPAALQGKALDALGAAGLNTLAGAPDGPWLLKLPANASARSTALKQLRGLSGPVSTKQTGVDDMTAALRAELPPATLEWTDTLVAVKHLSVSKDLLHVSPNGWNRTAQALPQGLGSLPSNDAYYRLQAWNLELIGLPAAFDNLSSLRRDPGPLPVVAMVDSGIVLDHPDLAQMILRRADGSVEGYDFVSSASNSGDGGGIDANPDDLIAVVSSLDVSARFHGTHTAGIVAAQGFNAAGITGVAPMARLMPLRAMGVQGGSDFDVIQAIRYASGLSNPSGRLPERRADIINMSLGRQGTCTSAMAEAIELARQQGLTVVVAAGNEAANLSGRPAPVGSPANCAGAIGVGAVDAKAKVTDYSNSGQGLSVVAPGGDMGANTTDTGYPDGIFSAVAGFDINGVRTPTYGFREGTSMAAPHVSAVLALVKFVNPNLTPAQIDLLLSSGRLTLDVDAPGRDEASGSGLIHAARAVQAAIDTLSTPVPLASIEVRPSSISFGSVQTDAEFELRLNATSGLPESVTRISWTHADRVRIAGQAGAFDSASLLGRFQVSINRGGLVSPVFPVVTVETSFGRRLFVHLSIDPAPSATTRRYGNAGTVYLLVVDALTNETLDTIALESTAGTYSYATKVPEGREIYLVAGNDPNNDLYLCGRLEACGDYPPFGAGPGTLVLTGPVRDADFSLAPYDGFAPSARPPGERGLWRRLR